MRDFWLHHIRIGRFNFCLGHNPSIDLETRPFISRGFTRLDQFGAAHIRIGRIFLDIDF